MNTCAKGSRIEKRCEDELKAQGYITWKTVRVRFCNLDLFHRFDVAAMHPEGKHLRLIQCKTNRVEKTVIEDIESFKVPDGIIKELWVWYDRKGWEKRTIGEANNETK